MATETTILRLTPKQTRKLRDVVLSLADGGDFQFHVEARTAKLFKAILGKLPKPPEELDPERFKPLQAIIDDAFGECRVETTYHGKHDCYIRFSVDLEPYMLSTRAHQFLLASNGRQLVLGTHSEVVDILQRVARMALASADNRVEQLRNIVIDMDPGDPNGA